MTPTKLLCAANGDRFGEPRCCIAALVFTFCGSAAGFELDLKAPELTLSAPTVPAIAVTEQLPSADAATRLFRGSDGTFAIDIELRRQPAEVSPRACAGLLLRALAARPGMPRRDDIYRAPLDVNTFLVIYVLGDEPDRKLHAHIISSAGRVHCADAHFERGAIAGEDVDDWRKTFTSARVAPQLR